MCRRLDNGSKGRSGGRDYLKESNCYLSYFHRDACVSGYFGPCFSSLFDTMYGHLNGVAIVKICPRL